MFYDSVFKSPVASSNVSALAAHAGKLINCVAFRLERKSMFLVERQKVLSCKYHMETGGEENISH